MFKATIKLQGQLGHTEVAVDLTQASVSMKNTTYPIEQIKWDIPISGTVYGTLLNYQGALHALGDRLNEAPYKEQPKAPILYIKPVNTLSSFGSPIPLPASSEQVEIGAALGIVIGKTATNVKKEEAMNFIAGYTVVNDVTLPHESVFRPAVKYRARDGFCPIGPWVVEQSAVTNPNDLTIQVFVNGDLVQENTTSNLIRSVQELMADVTEFMTLSAGDVLLVGVPENSPLVKAGDKIRIEIDQVGILENEVVLETELLPGGGAQ